MGTSATYSVTNYQVIDIEPTTAMVAAEKLLKDRPCCVVELCVQFYRYDSECIDISKRAFASNQIRYRKLAAPERFEVILYLLAAFDP
jgi:hypothetical protein